MSIFELNNGQTIPADRKAERQKDRKSERQIEKETKSQKDRKIER